MCLSPSLLLSMARGGLAGPWPASPSEPPAPSKSGWVATQLTLQSCQVSQACSVCPAVTAFHLTCPCLICVFPSLLWVASLTFLSIPPWSRVLPCPSSLPCCLFGSPQLSFVLSLLSSSCSSSQLLLLSVIPEFLPYHSPPSSPPSLLYFHPLLPSIPEHP